MIRAAFPRLAVGFFALGLSACTTLPNRTPWIEVLSKNFAIFSALEEAPSQQLADELELFRTIVETRTNATRLDSSVPTRIFVFDRQSSLASFGLDPSIPGMRENNVIVGALVEARPYFEKSLQLDPDDSLNQLDWAEYLRTTSAPTRQPTKERHASCAARPPRPTREVSDWIRPSRRPTRCTARRFSPREKTRRADSKRSSTPTRSFDRIRTSASCWRAPTSRPTEAMKPPVCCD